MVDDILIIEQCLHPKEGLGGDECIGILRLIDGFLCRQIVVVFCLTLLSLYESSLNGCQSLDVGILVGSTLILGN